KEVADALRSRFRGVVDMDARRWLAGRAGRAVVRTEHAVAPRVIEDEDTGRAGCSGDSRLRLWVIDLANLVVIPEIVYGGLVLQEREAFAVERELRRDRARVVDRQRMAFMCCVGSRHTWWRLESVVARPL